MDFIGIPPTCYISDLRQTRHLVLAHLLQDPSTPYAQKYLEKRAKGDFIILDNSAYELGGSVNLDYLIQAGSIINPHEIVLPDVLCNGNQTLSKAWEAYVVLAKHFPEARFMFVPQGNNYMEWADCLKYFLSKCASLESVYTIGIPVLIENWIYGRAPLIPLIPEKYDIHLLGWNSTTLSRVPEIDRTWPGRIRSTDTSKPFLYALMGKGLSNPQQHRFCPPLCPPRPKNYFEAETFAELGGHSTGILERCRQNYEFFRTWCSNE